MPLRLQTTAANQLDLSCGNQMTTCSIGDCDKAAGTRGWCSMHYQRWLRHGDPLTVLIRPSGTGGINDRGYYRRMEKGVTKLDHVRIAERALGKPLPAGAVVHHVDENRLNNDQSNLVICPSNAYHALLHARMRAMDATGDPNKRKCVYCKQYDDLGNFCSCQNGASTKYWHQQCNREHTRQERIRAAHRVG